MPTGGCMLAYWLLQSRSPVFFPFSEVDPVSPEGWSLPLMGIIAGRYHYLQDLLQLESIIRCSPPYSWPRYPSLLCVEAFARYPSSHPHKNFAEYILGGLSMGFRIGYSYQSNKLRSRGCNHPSCLANRGIA